MRWLASIMLVGCTSHHVDELLANPDFEQLDAAGWLTDWENHDGNPAGVIRVVKTPRVSGNYAVQWQIDAGGSGYEYWITQHGVPVTLGGHYELEGWYYVDEPGDIALSYIVRGQPGDEPDVSTLSDGAFFPEVVGDYARFQFAIDVPVTGAPTAFDVSLHVLEFTYKPVALTLDQVSLHER